MEEIKNEQIANPAQTQENLTPPKESQEENTQNKKPKKTLIIMLFFLLTVLILAGLYFAYRYFFQKTNNEVAKNVESVEKKKSEKENSAFGGFVDKEDSEDKESISYDPEIQQLINSYEKIPERAEYKKTIRGIKIYDTPEKRLSDEELKIIEEALNQTPQKIIDIKPNGIIASTRKESNSIYIESVALIAAYARGMNFYILDETFEGPGFLSGDHKQTIENITNTLIHEFVHIEQYKTIPKDKLKDMSPYRYSTWAMDYAEKTGWTKESYYWKLPDKTETVSRYGDSSIFEDQAVSISEFATGHPETISDDRVAWISNWFNKDPDYFSSGVFPKLGVDLKMQSEPAQLKLEESDFVNQSYINNYKNEYDSIKMYGWQTSSINDEDLGVEVVKNYYSKILKERNWSGTFSNLQGGYAGEFTYDNKKVYVEIVPMPFDEELSYILVLEGQ